MSNRNRLMETTKEIVKLEKLADSVSDYAIDNVKDQISNGQSLYNAYEKAMDELDRWIENNSKFIEDYNEYYRKDD